MQPASGEDTAMAVKWAYVRAFLRELPFLMFRAFEVAIVFSLVCLMFKGVFSPEEQQQRVSFAAPHLSDPAAATGITGKLRLRVQQTTRRVGAGGEIPRKTYQEAVVETSTDWFKANKYEIPDPTAIYKIPATTTTTTTTIASRKNPAALQQQQMVVPQQQQVAAAAVTGLGGGIAAALQQQQQQQRLGMQQQQPASMGDASFVIPAATGAATSRVLAEQVNTLGDDPLRLHSLIAGAALDMASESAALQARQAQQAQREQQLERDAALAMQEYNLEEALEATPAAAAAAAAAATTTPERVHPQPLRFAPAYKKVMVVTAVHSEPCHSLVGSHLMLLTIKNKQDYARIHDYAFHYATEEPDPGMKGAWNKIAVLQMLADKYSEREVGWFLWVDNDALILDVDAELPLEKWEGRDVVVWGCREDMMDGHDALAFNGGTLLLRNGPWLRQLLEEMAAEYGRVWDTEVLPGMPKYEAMARRVANFDKGLFEQAGLMDLMARHGPEYERRMVCDNSKNWHTQYRFHDWVVADYATEQEHPFVVHWPGCQFCRTSWLPSSSLVKMCVNTFVETFGFAHNASMRLLGEGFGMNVTNMIFKLADAVDAEWHVRDALQVEDARSGVAGSGGADPAAAGEAAGAGGPADGSALTSFLGQIFGARVAAATAAAAADRR